MPPAPWLSVHHVVKTPVAELAELRVGRNRMRATDVRGQHRLEAHHGGRVLPTSSSTNHPLERRRSVIEARRELVHVHLTRTLG